MTVFHPFVLDNAAGRETVVGIGSDSEKYGVGISSDLNVSGVSTFGTTNNIVIDPSGALKIKQSDETDYNWTKGIQIGYDTGSPSPILMFANNNNGYISDRDGELRITSDSSPIRIRTLNYGGDPELGVDMATFTPVGSVDLYHNGTKRFETTSTGSKVNGFLLKPDHPCCSVQDRSAGVLDTNGESNFVTYVFNNVLVNNGDYYDTSTGKFTCPVDGIYDVSVFILTRQSNVAHNVRVMKNSGGLTTFRSINGTGGSPEQNTGGRILVSCSATDTLYIQVSNAVGGDFFSGHNNFSVSLIG